MLRGATTSGALRPPTAPCLQSPRNLSGPRQARARNVRTARVRVDATKVRGARRTPGARPSAPTTPQASRPALDVPGRGVRTYRPALICRLSRCGTAPGLRYPRLVPNGSQLCYSDAYAQRTAARVTA